jgi:xylulokinase
MGPGYDPDPTLLNTIHLTGDYLAAGSVYAGGVLQWFANELGQPEVRSGEESGRSAYALLDEAADAVPPGCEGLVMHAFLMGEKTPLWDPYARGAYIGLTPYHTRAHLYRAALEGVAFGLRAISDIIADHGVHVTDIVSTDGGGKSAVWRGIFADVFDARVHRVSSRSATQLGNAALAAFGVGLIPNLEVTREWRTIEATADPDPDRVAHYERLYHLYRGFYERSKGLYPELVAFGESEPGQPS